MGLKSVLRDLLCRLGSHNWDRPEQSDVASKFEAPRVCRNCRKIEEPER